MSSIAAAISAARASRWPIRPRVTAPAWSVFKIDKGHCENVRLDGLSVVGTFYFPRAIHHGQGVMQPIIDERANEAQRDALFYILSGADQKVGTMFQIFSVIVETIKDPLFAPITFDWDLDKRTARIEVRASCGRTASRSAIR